MMLARYYGSNHAAKVLYGVILMFGVLIGLSASGTESAAAASLEALIAAVTIIVAEDYAEIIGFTIKNKRALSKSERREIFEDTFAIASFILIPCFILLASKFGLYDLRLAFNISFGYCLIVLYVFSYWAARLSSFSRYKSVFIATITALIGLAIICIKYIVSH